MCLSQQLQDKLNTLPEAVPTTALSFIYDETSALEQDALERAISERSEFGSIWVDMVNVTQDTTIRVYHKIDGVNYRPFYEYDFTVATDIDGHLVRGFTAYGDVKITLQCAGGGAGSVSVPCLMV